MTTLRTLAREYSDSVIASDFSVLAAYALGKTKEFVFREPDYVPTEAESEKLKDALLRRADKEPVAYIVGEKEFFGLPFSVTKDTLIPRPETEFLVEDVIRSLRHENGKVFVADIGTGSGNIIVSVAHALKTDDPDGVRFSFFTTDISSGALDVAKRNASRHGVIGRVTFFQGDLLEPIPKTEYDGMKRVLILANLPYLSRELYDGAMDDVRLHEPESALVANDDGLAYYIRLFKDISEREKEGLMSVPVTGLFEISPEQESKIATELLRFIPGSRYRFINDLSGRARILRFDIAEPKRA
ncbi:MAG: peptide chain release factor N(5)-glutamine methyltransferase [Candidatus Moranbacteria bacterium]|nr:peptide chain release factor N(5)-glutamine methyltransferase [Candidatus Moranbacteria bacterium]